MSPSLFAASLGFTAGAALGGCHFATLRWNAAAYAAGRWLPAIGLQLARLGLAGVGFTLVVRLAGAVGLVASLAGFWLGRTALLRHAVASP